MTERLVRFSSDVTAADAGRRTIVGTVVPYGVAGETSIGPVVFQPGSLKAAEGVKLLLEHDGRRPIGKATGFVDGPDRLVGSFRVSKTSAGTDALVEASDGLRDGLSVGAAILESTVGEAGELIVSSAELREVSLVTTPAFSEALVSQVAASGDPAPATPDDPEPAPSEEDDPMEHSTPEVAAAAVDPTEAPVIEAASPKLPYVTQHLRALDGLTAGTFAKASLDAQAGDHDAQALVTAALADNTTTTGAGLVPTRFLRDVIGVLDTSRPFITSISREQLPDAGMEFKVPRRTQAPTVAAQANEGDEVSSTAFTLDHLTVDVKTYGGGERISRQLIERSDPAYLDRLILEMGSAFAQATDKFAYDTVAAAMAAGNVSDGSTIAGAVGQAISDSYSAYRQAPGNLVVAPSTTGSFGFEDLLKAVDSDGRPLFSSSGQLVNQPGNLIVPGTQGSVMGLRLVVEPNTGSTVNPMVYPSGAATYYESAGAPVQVSVQAVNTLEVEVAVYGYCALAVKYGSAIRALTVTP